MSAIKLEVEKRAQAKIDTALCVNCGTCRTLCPTEAIIEHQRLICHICPNCEGVCNFDKGWDQIKFHFESREYAKEIACSIGCPIGIIPEGYVNLVAQDDIDGAYKLIKDKNPLSTICASICSHPCQDQCKRGTLMDEPIKIRALKKYVMENARHPKQRFRMKYDKRIAVVGGGPAGITAAFDLAKLGYPVTIFEKDGTLGGAMNWGVPGFRLDKKMMREEIDELIDGGVRVVTGTKITDLQALLKEGYAAVIVAIGSSEGRKLGIPGADAGMVYDAVEVMRAFNSGSSVKLGQNAVVIGAGSVALDTARSLMRAGVHAECYCVEDREHITAPAEEVEDALSEGIAVTAAASPVAVKTKNGTVCGITFRKVLELNTAGGRFEIVTQDGSDFDVACDTVVFATGQKTDAAGMGLKTLPNGKIEVRDNGMTSQEKIFACGDATGRSVNVITAMADGRKAALAADNMIWNRELKSRVEHELHTSPESEILYPVRFERIMPVAVRKIRSGAPGTPPEKPVVDVHTLFAEIPAERKVGKVAVVGAGITGLRKAIAYRDAGNDVTVFERYFSPGGSLRYLYSQKYVDKELLAKVIDEKIQGIKVNYGSTVGIHPRLNVLLREYDKVVLAIGNDVGAFPDVPGAQGESCFRSIDLMRELANGEHEKFLHDNIVVCGSGSHAVDTARAIRALGKKVTLVSPEDAAHKKAGDREYALLKKEGIDVHFGAALKAVVSDFIYVSGADFQKADGTVLHLACDGLVYADVFRADDYLLQTKNGLVVTDGQANFGNVEICYDTAPEEIRPAEEYTFVPSDIPRAAAPAFIDSEATFTREEAVREARRCMKCGYEESLSDKCIGCGICAANCPVNAITMIRAEG